MSSYSDIPNLPAPQSDDALRKTAASQVDLEINQSVAPIQSQIATATDRENKSLDQVAGMFNALQPVVDQSAQAVQTGYDQAQSQEKAIFTQAQANLQKMRANRAQDAQNMAQMIGGPVAMDEWTQPYDQATEDLTNLGAGQQLHTLVYAQAGEQEAQQFAGQVMPLVRTEQMASVRNQFEEQIREYNDQITALQAQRGAQVNKRFNDLRTQELQYGLQRAQFQLDKLNAQKDYNFKVQQAKIAQTQADRTFKLNKQQFDLDKTKADHDYQMAKVAAGQNKRKLDQADKDYDLELKRISIERQQADNQTKQLALQRDEALGYIDGKPTLETQVALGEIGGKPTLAATTEMDQAKQAAVTAGLNAKEINARIAESKANLKTATMDAKNKQTAQWFDILNNAMNPKDGVDTVVTQAVPIASSQGLLTPGAFQGKDGHWYVYQDVHVHTPDTRITDPNALVDYLYTAVNDPATMSRERATALVRDKLGLSQDWKYGDPDPRKATATPTTKTTRDTGGPAGAAGSQGSDTGQGGAGPATSGTTTTYQPTKKAPTDTSTNVWTPMGAMPYSQAVDIAAGRGDYAKAQRDQMYDWFIQQGYPLPKVVSGGKTATTVTTKAKPSDWAGYNVPLTTTGKFDLKAIRAQANAGNKKAQAWLSGHGWSQ